MRGDGARVTVMLLGIVLLHSGAAYSAVYKVGDSKGWDFKVAGWEQGKKFRAGDTMVFSYDKSKHNVLKVDKRGYDTCIVGNTSRSFTSGNDKIVLEKGPNYFICGFPGHCQGGMKIAAIVA